jgi:hypothetical protein
MSRIFSMAAAVGPLLRAHRLDDFETLLAADLGELLRCEKGGRELRRLVLDDAGETATFYLKRLGREPASRLLRVLLGGHRPWSGPLRELAALDALRQAGFATMEPVAWGERRSLGLPVAGFLLVRAVPGADGAQLFETLQGKARSILLEEVGELVGRLHAAGFFHVVRLKDLIRHRDTGVLVLIDRETGKPWAGRFSRQRAVASLARAGRRTLRDGHRFGPTAVRHFLAGYARGVVSLWPVSTGELRKQVFAALRAELHGKH